MNKSNTHFAQVPLEIVKKIVAEQIHAEMASAPDQGTEKETLMEILLETEMPSIAQSIARAEEESLNKL